MNQPLTFTTPARDRDPRTITVELCGEEIQVDRPKDATLYFTQTAIGDTASAGDQAMAVLQFIDGTLEAAQRQRFYQRICDRTDQVDLAACIDLLSGLFARWGDWDNAPTQPLVVTSDHRPTEGREVPVDQTELDLHVTAHPPKDIIRFLAASSLASTANLGQQSWALGLFLDAALDSVDAHLIARRMRDQTDGLDLEHVAEIVQGLVERWNAGNRAERRHAAQ